MANSRRGIAYMINDARPRAGQGQTPAQALRRRVVRLNPERSIKGSVLDGFADMFGSDGVRAGEVGHGATLCAKMRV